MIDLLRPIKSQIHKLWERLDGAPSNVAWATVTNTAPLLVHLEGDFDTDDAPVTVEAQTTVTGLRVGDRVLCIEHRLRVIVVQVQQPHARVAAGQVTITPSAANVATSASITFPAGIFSGAPVVVAGVSSPLATVGRSAVTADGFTATIIRNSTTNTVVSWYAIEM